VSTIATTTFQDGGLPILKNKCAMHRQASFYATNYVEAGAKVGETEDIFAFYLPPIDPAKGKPVLGGGEFVTAFADRPEVQAFQTFLASPEWANAKAKATPEGGWLSANKGLEVANLTNPIDALSLELLTAPDAVFRFDGSDLMPAKVGAGTFWKGMTAWVTGQSTQETVDNIENSWPS
jgi:alpha-glucoside transport system substrate-binding protein